MRFIDIINATILNIKQHRFLNTIMIISFTICFIIILMYSCLENAFYKFSQKNENLIKNRTIEFVYNKDYEVENIINSIEKFAHVKMVTEDLYLQGSYEGTLVGIYPINNKIINTLITDKNDILIPEKLYLGDKIIEGKNLIGKSIKIEHTYEKNIENEYIEEEGYYFSGTKKLGSEIHEYNVVNTYSENLEKDENIIFMDKNSLAKLKEKFYIDSVKEEKLVVVVDEYENLSEVWENILNNNFVDIQEQQSRFPINNENIKNIPIKKDMYSYIGISRNEAKIYKYIGLMILGISFVATVIILITLNMIQIIDNKYQIGILKVEGYLDKDIKKILILQNIIVLFLSNIIAIFTTIIIKNCINKELIKNDFIIYIIPFVISILIVVCIINIIYSKISKQSIIGILKEN